MRKGRGSRKNMRRSNTADIKSKEQKRKLEAIERR
jgi:hypothetical protein